MAIRLAMVGAEDQRRVRREYREHRWSDEVVFRSRRLS